ncbi:c-type cytochrome [Candidatus Halocynthiibacter alkanivorans]|jgi:cytochrome c|uniref:c-type cytochrome n=1 Tax=Candidatus Halocynthiibacter alkanivorans TaxID=2267619 RepID=UPI000DF263D1|nr:c-type cytochrome [Candidatus Halocynthiibacter alkanivorans]
MKKIFVIAAAGIIAGTGAFADGHADIALGEKTFKKCKACHTISNGDEVIFKGGRTGPNLYGVIGRQAGSFDGYKYGPSLAAAGEAGLIWDEESLATFISNPKEFLKEYNGDSKAKSKMSYKLKKGGEDLAAYLASVGPVMDEAAAEESSATQ